MTAVPSFADFFESLWGVPPFPWQARLAERVGADGWPRGIAIPTGCGKTAVIDVWAWALAAAACGAAFPQPRRLFFVIDRRIVVDDVFARASHIVRLLVEPPAEEVAAIAAALRVLGGDDPLRAARLRGGLPIDRSWAESLTQPLLCVSTVDQVGSRLLFRGYGLSRSARNSLPMHAAIVGNDALIVLDEAHLSAAFADTLSRVERERGRADEPLTLPWACVQMTATPRGDSGDVFRLDGDDRADVRLRARLLARKPLRLCQVPASRKSDELATAAVAEVEALLAQADPPRVIGVVVNRVLRARRIAERLRAVRPDLDVVLLIGPSRPLDRDGLLAEVWPRLQAGRERRPDDPPLALVATQTIEVGADLDLDALVTECASSDALRQRFGRVDRLGELEGRAQVVVLYRPQKESDPIYGDALASTWEWLSEQVDGGDLDAGVESLAEAPAETRQHVAGAPVLFPAYVDRWAQTSPVPAHDPDVGLFLHGPETGPADVGVVWRADLDGAEPERWREIVALTPPDGRELLKIGFAAVRRWLAALEPDDVSDLEGAPGGEVGGDASARRVLRWRGSRDPETETIGSAGMRPGDVIVVPASYGGCDREGWSPESRVPVDDLAEAAARERGRWLLRLHPAVLAQHGLGQEPVARVLIQSADDEGALEVDEDAVTQALAAIAETTSSLAGIATALAQGPRLAFLYPDGSGVVVADGDEPAALDDDESRLLGREVVLTEHQAGVAAEARRIADLLALPASLAGSLEWAAARHDEGKRDLRFQRLLRGGTEPIDDRVLAKSAGSVRDARASRLALRASGLPRGFRHEAISLALLEPEPDDVDRELAAHLVVSHHGCGRPFLPTVDDSAPWLDVTELERVDGEVPMRFWRLTRRFSPWGLALLEAVLRVADQQRSRKEQAGDR